MSVELTEVTNAIANIDKVGAGIAALSTKFKGMIYEVATTKGMEEARAARAEIREPRYEVERIRKAAKAPILALGKKLDAEAARITDELEKLESPIDAQIKAEEGRKEAERQAKIAAEMKRVADIKERIAELGGNPMLTPMSGSELIAEHLHDLDKLPTDGAIFQEFVDQAINAKAAGIVRLESLLAAARAHEQAAAQLKRDQEEFAERKRKADIEENNRREIARRDQEERDRANAAEIARLKNLADEQEAANAAERERLAGEARRIAEEQRKIDEAKIVVTPSAPATIATTGHELLSPVIPIRPAFPHIVACVGEKFGASYETVCTWIQPVPETER